MELRVLRGTRSYPGTVAPFRAWRGSRDFVAQSPKFHASAVHPSERARIDCERSLAQRRVTEKRKHSATRVPVVKKFKCPSVSRAGLAGCGKNVRTAIPRRAARRGICFFPWAKTKADSSL